jgi:hypothetical protein
MILRDIGRHLAVSFILLVVVVAIATTRADVDLWGHVRFGLDILHDLRLEAVDPYSFTSDRPWVNHEWLSEVILAGAWQWGGSTGLVAIKLLCVFGALALVVLSLSANGIPVHQQIPLLALAVAGMLPRVNHIRPQLFSVLLYAALMYAFSKSEQRSRRELLWCVPILTLWANLHGGWIVGLGTVGLWTFGLALEDRDRGLRGWWVVGFAVAGAFATLVNPYGLGLWQFLLETVRFGREAIGEWGPIWSQPHLLVLWSIFATMLGGALWKGSLRLLSPRALVSIAWGMASVRVNRLDAFFALSVVVLVGPSVVRFFSPTPLPRRAIRWGLVVATTLAVLLATPARRVVTCVAVHAPWWPEPEAIAFVRERELSGNMVTFFRWGEYAIWHLPPSIKISMDGRRETVYSERTVSSHIQLYDGSPEGIDYLLKLHPEYVWLPRKLRVTDELERQGWFPIFRGPQSVLLARRDVAPNHSRSLNTDGVTVADRCFPGP